MLVYQIDTKISDLVTFFSVAPTQNIITMQVMPYQQPLQRREAMKKSNIRLPRSVNRHK
jgi:hypothetical protein